MVQLTVDLDLLQNLVLNTPVLLNEPLFYNLYGILFEGTLLLAEVYSREATTADRRLNTVVAAELHEDA